MKFKVVKIGRKWLTCDPQELDANNPVETIKLDKGKLDLSLKDAFEVGKEYNYNVKMSDDRTKGVLLNEILPEEVKEVGLEDLGLKKVGGDPKDFVAEKLNKENVADAVFEDLVSGSSKEAEVKTFNRNIEYIKKCNFLDTTAISVCNDIVKRYPEMYEELQGTLSFKKQEIAKGYLAEVKKLVARKKYWSSPKANYILANGSDEMVAELMNIKRKFKEKLDK